MKSLISLLIFVLIFASSILCFSSCAKNGVDGKDGADGVTPTIEISEDGYWVINGEKTNVKAEGKDGEPGKDGVSGSESENPQGLDFYLKDDGTYAVAIGNARYLSHVDIPETYNGKAVTEIAYKGFDSARHLKSVSIPSSVTSMDSDAFFDCPIENVYISDIEKWYEINFVDADSNPLCNGANLYFNNEIVNDLVIPDGVTSIGNYAFSGCTSLTSIIIHSGVTSIGSGAFNYCTSLESVVLLEGITSVAGAFGGCSALKSINLPDGVTNIDAAFWGCESLTSIEIPDGVTSIGPSTFYGCSSLESIELPDSVTTIGTRAFDGCSSLSSIVIPKSVTSVGDLAFGGCVSLTDVYYAGSEEEWCEINFVYYDQSLKTARKHYNYVPEN